MNAFRFLGSLVCVGASVVVLAQSGTIRPSRTVTGITAVRDNTLLRFPQIDERTIPQPERPENPNPPYPKIAAPNGLPFGTSDLPSRVRATERWPGIGPTGWVPPDPNIAVGRTHVVSVVNCSVAFFTRAGTRQFQQIINGPDGWWGSTGASGFVFDPKCFYDRISRRFFVIGLDLDSASQSSNIMLAVSSGENPNGEWFKYKINVKQTVGASSFWMDYPSIGNSRDAIAMCGNMFGFSGGWNGVQFVVMPKAPLLSGGRATAFYLSDTGSGSAQIGRTPDSTSTRIFAAAMQSTSAARLYAISNPGVAPVLNFTTATIPSFSPLRRAANSAGGVQLDSLDGRLYNVVVRNGRMFAAHNVMNGPSDDRIACRWYQWNLGRWPDSGTPATAQAGNVIGNAGEDAHMNAVETNGAGDVAMIFTRSSPGIVADIMGTGRRETDRPGSMGAPRLLFTAESAVYRDGYRWGDYFDMAVDPLDDLTFWGIAMTANPSGNWQTHIFTWRISTSLTGTEIAPTQVETFQGRFAGGDVTSVRFSDNIYYSVASAMEAGLGQVGAAKGTFALGAGPNNWSFVTVNVEANGPAGATGMLWVWNYQDGKWDHVASWPNKGADATASWQIPEGQIAKYVSPTGEMQVVTRGLNPIRRGTATPLTYKVDRLWVTVRDNGEG